MARPMAMAETRNIYGMKVENQRGDIRGGVIKKTAPRDAWCSVESITPKITAPTMIPFTAFNAFFILSFSKSIGEDSIARVVVRNAAQADANRTH